MRMVDEPRDVSRATHLGTGGAQERVSSAASALTVRQLGHLLLWSTARAKQGWQNVCPHGVVTGSYSSFMHRMHSRSSVARSSILALPIAQRDDQRKEKQHLTADDAG